MRNRKFSIYLLKDEFNVDNALNEKAREALNDKKDETSKEIKDATLPRGGKLFIFPRKPNPPWWKKYFDIKEDLLQNAGSALLFVPVNESWFVFSFGHGYRKLDNSSYRYDFGLKVALNTLDPTKLKSTDGIDLSLFRRERIHASAGSDLATFNLDSVKMLKSITGETTGEYKESFKTVTGSVSLQISGKFTVDELVTWCRRFLELYNSTEYKKDFPNILSFVPIRDPEQISKLDEELLKAFVDKSNKLSLMFPEILDYHGGFFAKFAGAGKDDDINSDIDIENYYKYLSDNGLDIRNMDIKDLKKHKMHIIGDDDYELDSHKIYKCFLLDAKSPDGMTCHLCEGNWYKFDSNYITQIETDLDSFYKKLPLEDYTHNSEGDYNKSVADSSDMLCLDKAKLEGQIEPCDLYAIEKSQAVFYHVKRSIYAQKLSHLFYQGSVSATAIRRKQSNMQKLHKIIKKESTRRNLPSQKYIDPISSPNPIFTVVFAIITNKDEALKSKALPIFSKIALEKVMLDLTSMNVDKHFGFIKDKAPGKKKKTIQRTK